MAIPKGTNVHCSNVKETREALLIFKAHGIVYWSSTNFPTEEAYLRRFEEYPYISVINLPSNLVGNYQKQNRYGEFLTFQEFKYTYTNTKLKLLNSIKDFL